MIFYKITITDVEPLLPGDTSHETIMYGSVEDVDELSKTLFTKLFYFHSNKVTVKTETCFFK